MEKGREYFMKAQQIWTLFSWVYFRASGRATRGDKLTAIHFPKRFHTLQLFSIEIWPYPPPVFHLTSAFCLAAWNLPFDANRPQLSHLSDSHKHTLEASQTNRHVHNNGNQFSSTKKKAPGETSCNWLSSQSSHFNSLPTGTFWKSFCFSI